MHILTICFGIFTLSVGATILWANPQRQLNQVLFSTAFIQFIWIGCVYAAMRQGQHGDLSSVALWLRMNAVVSAFLPLSIWLTKEVIVSGRFYAPSRSLPWLGAGVALSLLAFSSSFLERDLENDRFTRGAAYYVYQSIAIPLYVVLITSSLFQLRRLHGIQRLEIQFFSLNLGVSAIIVAALTTIGNALDLTLIKRLSLIAIFLAYAIAAWAITTHRIFNFRQVFTRIAQKCCLLALFLAGTLSCISTRSGSTHFNATNAAVILILIIVTLKIDRSSKNWLDLDGKRHLTALRNSFIFAAQDESDGEQLKEIFVLLIKNEYQTDRALLLFSSKEAYSCDTLVFPKNSSGYAALCNLGWATPESIERQRPEASLLDLHSFLIKNNLGAVILSQGGGGQPALLIALGRKTRAWPYTYPEIKMLQNIIDLVDNVLSRSRLAMQVAAQAETEQLEMISRGLAHDLRNLLTPVSSFLIHSESMFPAGSVEAEVHSAARNSVDVMGEYIREALFFSRQLSTGFSSFEPLALLVSAIEITTTLAKDREVKIVVVNECTSMPRGDFTLLQRLLVNLLSNAIDASSRGQTVRLVAASEVPARFTLKVQDQGCGVSRENLGRIFDPYFTTKSAGNDARGFGLGLTICLRIAEVHAGTIEVDSIPGKGSTFLVDLPSQPPPFRLPKTLARGAGFSTVPGKALC